MFGKSPHLSHWSRLVKRFTNRRKEHSKLDSPTDKNKSSHPGPCECFPAITRLSHEGLRLIPSRSRKLTEGFPTYNGNGINSRLRQRSEGVDGPQQSQSLQCCLQLYLYFLCICTVLSILTNSIPFYIMVDLNILPFCTFSFSNSEAASLF